MEDKPIEMAAGNPGTSIPVPEASGFSNLPVPQIVAPPTVVKLNTEELRRFKFLLGEEVEAAKKAEDAKIKRERFCLTLEKKLNIAGHYWDVDFNKGVIVLGEKR